MICLTDADCPYNLVCYTNTSWYSTYNEKTPDNCLCSTWYGYTNNTNNDGDDDGNCNQILVSPTSLFWVISAVIILILQTTLLVFLIYEIFKLFRHRLFALDPQTVGTLQLFVADGLNIVGQCGSILAAVTPAESGYIPGPGRDKEDIYHDVWIGMIAIGAIFETFSAVTLALVWIEIALRVKTMTNVGEIGLTRYRYRVIVFEVIFCIVAVILMIVADEIYVGYIAFLLEVLLFGIYVRGSLMLSATISKSLLSEKPAFQKVLLNIRRTTIQIIVLDLLLSISTLINIVANFDWKNYALPNELAVQIFFTQAVPFLIVLVGFVLQIFLNRIIDQRIRVHTSEQNSHQIITKEESDKRFGRNNGATLISQLSEKNAVIAPSSPTSSKEDVT